MSQFFASGSQSIGHHPNVLKIKLTSNFFAVYMKYISSMKMQVKTKMMDKDIPTAAILTSK